MKTKAQNVLESARVAALTAAKWGGLSNAIFDPVEGLLAKAYPTRDEREKFMQTDEYKAICALIEAAEDFDRWFNGVSPDAAITKESHP